MQGINTSQAKAEQLQRDGYEVFLSEHSGFWVRTDNLTRTQITYHVRRTGDEIKRIPRDASSYVK